MNIIIVRSLVMVVNLSLHHYKLYYSYYFQNGHGFVDSDKKLKRIMKGIEEALSSWITNVPNLSIMWTFPNTVLCAIEWDP